jgi:hypothetical protein
MFTKEHTHLIDSELVFKNLLNGVITPSHFLNLSLSWETVEILSTNRVATLVFEKKLISFEEACQLSWNQLKVLEAIPHDISPHDIANQIRRLQVQSFPSLKELALFARTKKALKDTTPPSEIEHEELPIRLGI